MEQKYIYGLIALSLATILGVGFISAFGPGYGFMNSQLSDDEKNLMQEQRQAMENAIETKDYSAWKTLMEQEIARMQSQITQENFNEIVENHAKMSELREAMKDAKESGDFSKVQELKENLGIDGKAQGNGKGMGMGKMSKGMCNSDLD